MTKKTKGDKSSGTKDKHSNKNKEEKDTSDKEKSPKEHDKDKNSSGSNKHVQFKEHKQVIQYENSQPNASAASAPSSEREDSFKVPSDSLQNYDIKVTSEKMLDRSASPRVRQPAKDDIFDCKTPEDPYATERSISLNCMLEIQCSCPANHSVQMNGHHDTCLLTKNATTSNVKSKDSKTNATSSDTTNLTNLIANIFDDPKKGSDGSDPKRKSAKHKRKHKEKDSKNAQAKEAEQPTEK